MVQSILEYDEDGKAADPPETPEGVVQLAVTQNDYQILDFQLRYMSYKYNSIDLPYEVIRILLMHPDPQFRVWCFNMVKDVEITALEMIFEEHDLEVAMAFVEELDRSGVKIFDRFLSDHPAERSYVFIRKFAERSGLYPPLILHQHEDNKGSPILADDAELLAITLEDPELNRCKLGKVVNSLRLYMLYNPLCQKRIRPHYRTIWLWLKHC